MSEEFQDVALIFGDPHLMYQTWADRKLINGDAFEAFERGINYALEAEVAVILCGDNFDSKRPTPDVVQFFCQQMDRMRAACLPVFYIQGNHDLCDPPWPAVHCWPEHIHNRQVEYKGVSFSGLDWQPVSRFYEAITEVPQSDFLITHQLWLQFGTMGGDTVDAKRIVGRRGIISGDMHLAKSVTVAAGDAIPLTIWSPGSMTRTAISEPDQHFVYMLQADGSGDFFLSPRQLPSRPVFRAFVYNNKSRDEALLAIKNYVHDSSLPAAVRLPLFAITYTDGCDDVYAMFSAAAAENAAHLFLTKDTSGRSAGVEALPETRHVGMTMMDAVRKEAEVRNLPEEVVQIAELLWQSDDVADTLENVERSYCAVDQSGVG